MFFFFQAEDGIRDIGVTGVQTCALPISNANVWPRRTPLGAFADNVAHSNAGDGLHVDNGPRPDGSTEGAYYKPRANPTPPASGQPDSAPVEARFERLTAYKNRYRAGWLRGEHHRV